MFSSPSPQTVYKLTILFMLDSVDFSLSNAVISDFLLLENFTDYFTIQKAFSELETEGLIQSSSTYKTTYYTITQDGKNTLECFHYEISKGIKDDVKNYLKQNFNYIIEHLSIVTNYTNYKDNSYLVECKILERDFLLAAITLNSPTETQALEICNNFKEKSSDIYSYLIKTLL